MFTNRFPPAGDPSACVACAAELVLPEDDVRTTRRQERGAEIHCWRR